MKPNVDLTENRDFHINNQGSRWILSPITGEMFQVPSFNYSLEEAAKELLFTGCKMEREYKRMELSFAVPNQHCDRCGTRVAWRFIDNSSLCHKCQETIEEKHNIWWRRVKRKSEELL